MAARCALTLRGLHGLKTKVGLLPTPGQLWQIVQLPWRQVGTESGEPPATFPGAAESEGAAAQQDGSWQVGGTRLSSPQEPNFTAVKWKKMLIAAILFIVRLHLPVFVVCKQAEFSTNCSVC